MWNLVVLSEKKNFASRFTRNFYLKKRLKNINLESNLDFYKEVILFLEFEASLLSAEATIIAALKERE